MRGNGVSQVMLDTRPGSSKVRAAFLKSESHRAVRFHRRTSIDVRLCSVVDCMLLRSWLKMGWIST